MKCFINPSWQNSCLEWRTDSRENIWLSSAGLLQPAQAGERRHSCFTPGLSKVGHHSPAPLMQPPPAVRTLLADKRATLADGPLSDAPGLWFGSQKCSVRKMSQGCVLRWQRHPVASAALLLWGHPWNSAHGVANPIISSSHTGLGAFLNELCDELHASALLSAMCFCFLGLWRKAWRSWVT